MKCTDCGGVNEPRVAKCRYCGHPSKRNMRYFTMAIATAGGVVGALMFLASAAA